MKTERLDLSSLVGVRLAQPLGVLGFAADVFALAEVLVSERCGFLAEDQ